MNMGCFNCQIEQLNQLDKHLFVFSTSNQIVLAAKYFIDLFFIETFAKFCLNFAKKDCQKFSQKSEFSRKLQKKIEFYRKFCEIWFEFRKNGLLKIFAKMIKIFVFEWLIEISRQRLNENLETLLYLFPYYRYIAHEKNVPKIYV